MDVNAQLYVLLLLARSQLATESDGSRDGGRVREHCGAASPVQSVKNLTSVQVMKSGPMKHVEPRGLELRGSHEDWSYAGGRGDARSQATGGGGARGSGHAGELARRGQPLRVRVWVWIWVGVSGWGWVGARVRDRVQVRELARGCRPRWRDSREDAPLGGRMGSRGQTPLGSRIGSRWQDPLGGYIWSGGEVARLRG